MAGGGFMALGKGSTSRDPRGKDAFKHRQGAGFSPGGFSIQDDGEVAWLRYLRDVSHGFTDVIPPASGDPRVRR